MTTADLATIALTCTRMRRDIIEMVGAAGSGHPGGSLSSVEILATLYFGVMKHDPANPAMPDRDRFVLSKGHAAPVLYAVLAEAGYFPREELVTLRKLGSRLQGHPDARKTPGVEVSTGSLGQGLALANGMALALRLDANAAGRDAGEGPTVYCLLGDGELQEGEVWEAAMLAAHYCLDNVVAIVDLNGMQIDGPTCEVMDVGDVEAKFAAFGWHVVTCDGHDLEELADAFAAARAYSDGPAVIVADTVKGKGVSFMEGLCDWHGKAPNAEQCATALSELELTEGSAS
ncbi:MAG: transketolase [Coriobacteriia bacterium]|nr:transketolase [Coriobacteriia bacterium]